MVAISHPKADALAEQFNRSLRRTNDAALTVHRVVMLHLTRTALEALEAEPTFVCDNLPAVKAELDRIEQECRNAGLFEALADLPRAERRRLHKLMEV